MTFPALNRMIPKRGWIFLNPDFGKSDFTGEQGKLRRLMQAHKRMPAHALLTTMLGGCAGGGGNVDMRLGVERAPSSDIRGVVACAAVPFAVVVIEVAL